MSSYAITGASRGLGLELVTQLSSVPSNTIFALVRDPNNSPALQGLANERSNIHVLTADVTDPDAILNAAASVSTVTGGKLDILIHNAAGMDHTAMPLAPSQLPFEREALAAMFRLEMSTSVFGAIWTTNAFLPLLEKGREKKVVHITTAMADVDFVNTTGIAYGVAAGVSKAGLNLVTAKYAAEFAEKGIKFLALSPGWVNTMEGPAPPQMKPFFELMLSQFRRAEPKLEGPLTKSDSVRMQLEVIDKLDQKLSGQVVSHHGDKNWF